MIGYYSIKFVKNYLLLILGVKLIVIGQVETSWKTDVFVCQMRKATVSTTWVLNKDQMNH